LSRRRLRDARASRRQAQRQRDIGRGQRDARHGQDAHQDALCAVATLAALADVFLEILCHRVSDGVQ
jgi:hypothetical protein